MFTNHQHPFLKTNHLISLMILGGPGYTLEFQGVSTVAAYPLIKQPSHGNSHEKSNKTICSWHFMTFHEKMNLNWRFMEISMEIFTSPWMFVYLRVGLLLKQGQQSKDLQSTICHLVPARNSMNGTLRKLTSEWNITFFDRRLRYIF